MAVIRKDILLFKKQIHLSFVGAKALHNVTSLTLYYPCGLTLVSFSIIELQRNYNTETNSKNNCYDKHVINKRMKNMKTCFQY